MKRLRMVCRFVAVVIAIAAVIDPAITTVRSGKPLISVVAVDPLVDSSLASRVRGALDDQFVVIASPLASTDATVLVGNTLPASFDGMSAPTFAVTAAEPPVTIASVRAPASASVHAPVRIDVVAEPRDSADASIALALEHNGVVVDRVLDTTAASGARVRASLTFVPTAAGAVRLRVLASRRGRVDTTMADVAVEIHDVPLSVLVFDPRASYQSTFVRRALERDPRLRITSRTVTSRNISAATGSAPSRLDDATDLTRFDAIVVGAPDALTERDVAALERFLRERGGSVLLLLDVRARGPFERLVGVREWRYRDVDRGTRIVPVRGDTASLRASQQYTPAELPYGAVTLARAHLAATDTGVVADGEPVVWSTSVGVGHLVVSGALDAWRYREREVSAFDQLWQQLVVEAAARAIPPLSLTLARSVLAPRETTTVMVSVRSASLRDASAEPTSTRVWAELEVGDSASAVRAPVQLWPSGQVGELHGTLVAPAQAGVARLVVSADGHRTESPVWIEPDRRHAAPDGGALLSAWVAAQGGRVIPSPELASLPRTLEELLRAEKRAERWHPMRSFLWLLPFALALSAEWLLRRRSGLA